MSFIVPAGALFVHSPAEGSGIYPIILPAANPDGLIIRTLSMHVSPGTLQLYASLTAPATIDDTSLRVVFRVSSSVGPETLPYQLYIQPGLGLWYTSSGTTGTSTNFVMTYDLIGPDYRPAI